MVFKRGMTLISSLSHARASTQYESRPVTCSNEDFPLYFFFRPQSLEVLFWRNLSALSATMSGLNPSGESKTKKTSLVFKSFKACRAIALHALFLQLGWHVSAQKKNIRREFSTRFTLRADRGVIWLWWAGLCFTTNHVSLPRLTDFPWFVILAH